MHVSLEHALDRTYAIANWWLEGLWMGLPAHLRDAFFVERRELIVHLSERMATVTVGQSGADAITLDLSDPDAAPRLRQVVEDADRADITLVLPRSIALTHQLWLPAAAEAELHGVLHHELDRLTPFAIDEIVFSYRIRERTESKLLIDLALAQRDALDESLGALERVGLRPTTITAEGRDGYRLRLNLLPRRRRLQRPFAALPFKPEIAIGTVLAFLSALYLPLVRYDDLLRRHEDTAEAVLKEAAQARAALTEQETALARDDFLVERRGEYIPPIELVLELTTKVPEHTWLSRMSISGGEVVLQGESAAATDLLKIVESTDALQEARFQAPVARNDESGKEQFTIVAALAGDFE